MTRAILAALLCATAAGAETRQEWTLGGTRAYVEISAPTRLGCLALVTFRDEPAHSGDETFTLTYDGVTVDFRIAYNGGMPGESLTIEAPHPYVAVPFILEPGEHDVAEAHICAAGVAS